MKKMAWLLCCLPLLSLSDCKKNSHGQGQFPLIPPAMDTLTVAGCRQCIILTDQAAPAIDIVDAGRGDSMIWQWQPSQSDVALNDVKWFTNPDDAKPVYDNNYLLVNASGGGVALIRLADKKVVFYAYAGKNPHSSAILPDGNIVTASSTDNRLVVFHTDTTGSPDSAYKRAIPLPFAHNVVWDNKRQVLWSAANTELYEFRYNFNCEQPDLTVKDSFQLPGDQAHDLFPVYGKDSLWFTNTTGVYTIDMKTMQIVPAGTTYQENIKSVSSGPAEWPVIIMQPQVSWWSDDVLDMQGNIIFQQQGLELYKARWFLPNLFSEAAGNGLKVCH